MITDIKKVPREWVYQFYLNLNETLTGQDVKITSVFNTKEENPSMCIYWCKNSSYYKWKDYSTDRGGDPISLVKDLFDLNNRGQAAIRILNDYSEYILNNGQEFTIKDFKVKSKYQVKEAHPRNWNVNDSKYWNKYNVNG